MKKMKLLFASALLSVTMSMSSLAGSWQSDATGWWFRNDDGSYPVNTWLWIDGNGDGIAENYFFDANGYCLMNTATPDNYFVDANGAWIVNGVIQTKVVSVSESTAGAESTAVQDTTTAPASVDISSSPFEGYTIIANTNTHKYHVPTCASVRDMNPENYGYSDDADYLESIGYVACKRCH
ncbi:MAG: Ada metal-binding domain-containing protein [Lachnospiraceae bacterium]|nr:Ada metal-binding domain-containing protein [Lachnospiraceae bacterium]